ncbi:MAG TPA: hypothetical protein VI756_04495, partial [Blastocatellia bacterium]
MKKTPLAVIIGAVVVVCALCAVCTIIIVHGVGSHFSADSKEAAVAKEPAPVNVAPVSETGDPGWPRTLTSGDTTVTMYDPQINKWDGDQIDGDAAVSVEGGNSQQVTYGEIYFTAHATQDKQNRTVTLDNFKVTKGDFPTAANNTATYLAIIQQGEGGKTDTV